MEFVYAFEQGSKEQRYLLGGKGANLSEMTRLGLPVPPGFTISTDACKRYMASGDAMPNGLMDEVAAALVVLEAKTGQALAIRIVQANLIISFINQYSKDRKREREGDMYKR